MTFADAANPRWRGDAGRMEVWYSSITDPVTGTGAWIHYELVAPTDDAPPYRHGWIAVFPKDGAPMCERFGPERGGPVQSADAWFRSGDNVIEPSRMSGRAGSITWDVSWSTHAPPLWTFPKVAWDRQLLPGAQCVPVPTGEFSGTIDLGGEVLALSAAPGNIAHIYSHGSAKRWGWLHADLGRGEVLEIVTATSMTPGLDRVPPMAYLRLRSGGRDWPRGLLPSIRTTSDIGGHDWSVRGGIGRRRIRVDVHQPPDRSVALEYVDPDGETATCTNSEVADATIVVEERTAARWRVRNEWQLDGTAHAEFGVRP